MPDRGALRAIVFTPQGRDAAVAQSLLREAGVQSVVCGSLGAFQDTLTDQAAFAVITEEAMLSADLRGIAAWVAAQPTWSDLPFIILTQRGGGPERNPDAARLSEIFWAMSPFSNGPFTRRPSSASPARR